MPNDVFGVPLHPLLVHAVVVLVPLAALGALATVLFPSVRTRLGWLIAATAAASAGLIPLVTGSGESLQTRVPETALVVRHTEMGGQLLPWAIALAVGIIAVMALAHLRERRPSGQVTSWWGSRAVAIIAMVVTIVGAGGAIVQVIRIGHSGAEATWSGRTTA